MRRHLTIGEIYQGARTRSVCFGVGTLKGTEHVRVIELATDLQRPQNLIFSHGQMKTLLRGEHSVWSTEMEDAALSSLT